MTDPFTCGDAVSVAAIVGWRYGAPLEAGVALYEYQPAMIHAKVLLIGRSGPLAGTAGMSCMR